MLTATQTVTSTDEAINQAIMPPSAIAHHEVSMALTVSGDDEFVYLHSEILAGRRQMARGMQDLAEGIVRTSVALHQMHANQAYRSRGYATFEDYLEHCQQGLAASTARRYITTLNRLGSMTYRELLVSVRAQRTFCLAEIKDLDPTLFEALIEPNGQDGTLPASALSVGDLEQTIADLRRQLAQQAATQAELNDQVAAARQISQHATARLAEVEKLNGEIFTERDQVLRDLTDEAEKHRKTREKASKVKRELEQKLAQLQQPIPEVALAAKSQTVIVEEKVLVEEVVEVVAQCDPALLADLVHFCVEALRRYRELAPYIASNDAGDLYVALADVVAHSDSTVLIPLLHACATNLRETTKGREHDDAQERELQAALAALGAAVRARYPAEANHAG